MAGAAAATQAKAAGSAMPMIDPLGIFGVVAMVLPVAVLFSAVIFTVALFAKSYKEAQSYISPMIIVVILPAVIGMLPGVERCLGSAGDRLKRIEATLSRKLG